MSTIGERIKNRRLELGLTQEELGTKIGVQRAAINKYEKGLVQNIKRSTQQQLADALGMDVVSLFYPTEKKSNRIKVYGSVPAGIPIEAIEDVIDWEDIPQNWIESGDKYIGLKVKGDSMSPKYIDGDTIIIKLQPDCESGQDAVVYINGYDATFKRVIKQHDGIMLQPLNPEYEPRQYDYNDDLMPISILGVVVEIRRKV